jgi:tetratricopeptide (TPR) repeat protein/tRNA A-37 threonylcarbamoyl transferase component Bud32
VPDSLFARLQNSLAGSYQLERELGGGGMSRVFVADELALGRKVVVKVLLPELAAGISMDRFKREIQVAARLQHPHIVPVLTAGEAANLPYYTMPFVVGESLRTRIGRDGALPVADTVAILRDVARALDYAHGEGVVHRDIKPDNVLLAGRSATVTDFGIAKALSASRTESGATLTSAGTSIGTPAYIAPEQAAGDLSADHRADLYAFGCMAYELLTGRTPFAGLPPQKLFVAHMSQAPESLGDLRSDLPPALGSLVMRCLSKDPADRPQSAAEVLRELESSLSSGGHEAAPVIALATRRQLGRALAIYAAAFVGVAILSRAAILVIGLPDWVFPGSLMVMALGLPVILFTALVHHQTRIARTVATQTPGGTRTQQGTMTRISVKASPILTWNRTAWGGGIAIGLFTLAVGVWMVLRALGIGPAGTLLAAGVIGQNDRLLVADFASPAGDSTLGTVITEALRTDLAQSRTFSLLQPNELRDALKRTARAADARIDESLARELATREGLKAFVSGKVVALGGVYQISASLVAPRDLNVLAAVQETAKGQGDVIPAIDRLARALRERIGDSFKSIQATPRLERVTTGSLDALRAYVQGLRLSDNLGDQVAAIPKLEEAIRLDTTFASAYRKLGIILRNMGNEPSRQVDLMSKAYAHRDRLTDVERLRTEGSYWMGGPKPDLAKAIAAYESLLEIDPKDYPSLTNLGVIYGSLNNGDKAMEYTLRAVAADSTSTNARGNLAEGYGFQGKWEDADRTLTDMKRRFPTAGYVDVYRFDLLYARGRVDSARRVLDSTLRALPPASPTHFFWLGRQSTLLRRDGRLAEAERIDQERRAARRLPESARDSLNRALGDAWIALWFRNDRAAAARVVDEALKRHPLESFSWADRPYTSVALTYALLGQSDRARAVQAAFEKSREKVGLSQDLWGRPTLNGYVAVSEKRYAAAVEEFRKAHTECPMCDEQAVAYAQDLGGQADSAIAAYERALAAHDLHRITADQDFLAPTHKRLGELYEQKGDREKAAEHFAAFVDIWKNADPELQAQVQAVKSKLARLRDVERK